LIRQLKALLLRQLKAHLFRWRPPLQRPVACGVRRPFPFDTRFPISLG